MEWSARLIWFDFPDSISELQWLAGEFDPKLEVSDGLGKLNANEIYNNDTDVNDLSQKESGCANTNN